ncbi:unnamed protein product [Owenia fusiformis]|uniref:Uncharacterized protein n=1 Tax=Owenia fusiformis TaxID=6347 RepID=A0A8J1Y119_OWEFU|nr:unnamed protein product [Owenia fusiformis]
MPSYDDEDLNGYKGRNIYKPSDAKDGVSMERLAMMNNGNNNEKELPKIKTKAEEAKEDKRHNLSKRRILKNIVLISLGILFLFAGIGSLAMLQSSLNEELGVIGLSVNFATVIICCMFLPPMVISKMGCKWTMVFSLIGFLMWMASNMYPVWWVIIPCSFVMGVCWGPLWTAQCTYFTESAGIYADITGEDADTVIAKFFGIFFMMFQSGPIWGNLISSSILSQGMMPPEEPLTNSSMNATVETEDPYAFCGAKMCPMAAPSLPEIITNVTSNVTMEDAPLHAIDIKLVLLLVGIDVALGIIGMLIIAFAVDKLDAPPEKFSMKIVKAVGKQMCTKRQLLLVPLTMYVGIEQAFMIAEYTRAYTGCALGIHMIGYSIMCFGIVGAVVSLASGFVVERLGRIVVMAAGLAMHGVLLLTFLLWSPHPDQAYLFFIFPALWAFGDSIWQAQINALYGAIFAEDSDAAFSNYRMWESLGFIIAYIYSALLCVYVKIYIVMAVLVVGFVCYLIVEIGYRKEQKNLENKENDKQRLDDIGRAEYARITQVQTEKFVGNPDRESVI